MKTILAQDVVVGNYIVFNNIDDIWYGVWSSTYSKYAARIYGGGDDRETGCYCDLKPKPLTRLEAEKSLEYLRSCGWHRNDISVKPLQTTSTYLTRGCVSEVQEYEDDNEQQFIKLFGLFVNENDKKLKEVLLKPDQTLFLAALNENPS